MHKRQYFFISLLLSLALIIILFSCPNVTTNDDDDDDSTISSLSSTSAGASSSTLTNSSSSDFSSLNNSSAVLSSNISSINNSSSTTSVSAYPTPSFNGTENVTIHIIGDSTVSDYTGGDNVPQAGWGQMLNLFFNDKVTIYDHAVGGTSTKSFRDLGYWATVISAVTANDIVMIQFGHNDEKASDPVKYTTLDEYYNNLLAYINEIRAKNAFPILVTPVERRSFDTDGTKVYTHQNYDVKMRELSNDYDVLLVDLQQLSFDLFQTVGVDGTKEIFLFLSPGQHPNYSLGAGDNTHFIEYGASKLCELITGSIDDQNITLDQYLIADPTYPTPWPTPTPTPTPSGTESSLVAYWSFDSVTDINANGKAETAPDIGPFYLELGANDPDIMTSVTGKVNNAILLSNDNTGPWNYLKSILETTDFSFTDSFTVECWINLNSTTYASNPTIIDFRNGTTSQYGWRLELSASNLKPKFRTYDGLLNYTCYGTTAISADTWYYLTAVFDGTAGELKVYVNGALESTISGTIGENTEDIVIVGGGSTSTDKNIKGMLDELKIYNIALSDSDILTNYNNSK